MSGPLDVSDAQREGQGRLLVVDDEQQLRRLLVRSLSRAGHQVVEATGGQMALQLARLAPFDLVISDVQMPDMSGIELLVALRLELPALPVVLVSGSFDDLSVQRAKELGALACLSKPVPFHTLHHLSAQAVQESASRKRPSTPPGDSHERLRSAPSVIPDAEAAGEAAKK